MDLMIILGWIFAAVLIVFGIVFQSPDPAKGIPLGFVFSRLWSFLDWPSVAVTIGGTYAALMASFPLSAFANSFKHLRIILFPTKYDPYEYIAQIVEFAKEARMKGLLSLEDKLAYTKDEFLKRSLMLVVDSVEPEKVKQLLEAELEYLDERHTQARAFYEKGAGYAPAFGMIGTLMGLINMLKNMDDPDTIGPQMAVALVTTFYGTIMANVVFMPIANKLKIRHDEEFLCKVLICEGVQAIQSGENPRFIEEKLTMLLEKDVSKRTSSGSSFGSN